MVDKILDSPLELILKLPFTFFQPFLKKFVNLNSGLENAAATLKFEEMKICERSIPVNLVKR